jgi:hypothetical protein
MTRRRWVLVGAVLVVAWLGTAAVLLLGAADDLRAGRDAARRAEDLMDAEAVADGAPLDDLREAADRFSSAESSTGHPLLAPARFLPVLGRQLRSVNALSGAAAEVADAAADGVASLRGVLDQRGLGAEARLDQLRQLDDAVHEVERRIRGVDDLGPSKGLVAPLADAREELATELADAQASLADAAAGARAAVSLFEGPRRYLVIAANNAEMRAGSGMWLSGGVLTTQGGFLQLGDVEPIYEHAVPEGAVAPEGHFAARWGWLQPTVEWRNLLTSPRFAESAALAARMWEASGEEPVDGVVSLDPVAVRALIAATGPVMFGSQTIGTEEVLPFLLHDQYEGIDGYGDATVDRRNALNLLTAAVFTALERGDWAPATLARELGDAVRGRHLMAWSRHADEQEAWEVAGMSGDLGPSSLLLSVMNTGANKLDWFMKTHAQLSTAPAAGGTEVTVRIRLSNETPPGESGYIAGPHPELNGDLSPGDYRGILAINVPGQALELQLEGVPNVDVQGADGPTQVVGAQFVLPRGRSMEATLRFRLPGERGVVEVEPSARVPAIEWQYGDAVWQDIQARSVNW